ncbi:hypothetical protein RJD24_01270 [Bacillaceae bacterium IKA-2]|nr:hypothetical protein RJD24_01270 [Bacillaceae bacterium IKA-2]
MKKITRGIVLFTMILLLQLTLLPPNEAYAEQSNVTITEINIKVMPEFINPEEWDYELPSLLVGYHGTFTNHSDTAYTGELKVSVPTQSPYFKEGFVARFKNQEDVEPSVEDYTVNVEEQTFSWTPKEPIEPNENYYFVLEYFTASIEGITDRNFDFTYTAESDLKLANIAFYAPFRSEDFQIDKEPDITTETFGLQFYLFEYSDVKLGDVLDFSVTYKKDDIVTTMEAYDDFDVPDDDAHAGMMGQDGNQASADASESLVSTENIILIIIALIIVGAFVFIVVRGKQGKGHISNEKGTSPKKIVNKEAEIKKLRKMLADGQIDEKTYKEKRAKLG